MWIIYQNKVQNNNLMNNKIRTNKEKYKIKVRRILLNNYFKKIAKNCRILKNKRSEMPILFNLYYIIFIKYVIKYYKFLIIFI